MKLQRIDFINKNGDPCSWVLEIIKKQSKFIVTRNPTDGSILPIPRHAVEKISEPEKENNGR